MKPAIRRAPGPAHPAPLGWAGVAMAVLGLALGATTSAVWAAGAGEASPAAAVDGGAAPVGVPPVPPGAAESGPEAPRGLARLVALYEGMKPAEAAAVLAQLDPELSTRILLGLRPRQAAKVLASLSPRKAAELTTRMSRMRLAEGPREGRP